MALERLARASVVIRSPLLEVFDYIAEPRNLPQWVPYYSNVERIEVKRPDRISKGDRFKATLALLPPDVVRMFPPGLLPFGMTTSIEVCVDDVVHGRRIAYRSSESGWTTICDFEPSAGRTIFTTTHSTWSASGLALSYLMGPMQAFAGDMLRSILEGVKRRLEGRALDPEPRIFFSYRRALDPYVGGRVFDALTSEFGLGTVFRDSNSLLAGSNFQDDITKAIRACRVVVVYICDRWEDELKRRADAGEDDGLRKELEDALGKRAKNSGPVRIVPVLTTNEERIDLYQRMRRIEEGVKALGNKAPGMQRVFTASRQIQLLRVDPDFNRDLEHLMRAVWTEFRS